MRQLANLALTQLAAWEAVARHWSLIPVYLSTENGHREGPGVMQLHYTCGGMEHGGKTDPPIGGCGQAIICIDNSHGPYHTNVAIILAAITAHIRNVHRDLEGRVYRDA